MNHKITDVMKETIITKKEQKTTEERKKDFVASYRALCIRHNMSLSKHALEFDQVYVIDVFDEENIEIFEVAAITKELREDVLSKKS